MASIPEIRFADADAEPRGALILFAGEGLALGPRAAAVDAASGGALTAALRSAAFKGKEASALDLVMPRGLSVDRVGVIGTGKGDRLGPADLPRLGGIVMGLLRTMRVEVATVLPERPAGDALAPDEAAEFALGLRLRGYVFDRYKAKKPDEPVSSPGVTVGVGDAAKARRAFAARQAVAAGVELARDLVNEPANVLGPVEFAAAAQALESLGVRIEVLDEPRIRALDMRALVGVAQGSARPPRVVVLQWQGGKAKAAPLAVVGKGVVFDSGGVSIKPAASMEDMKGDMGGAAAVVGLMKALAGRKAKANVVGLIGLVENMPDGNAQRPGDIVTARSGTTVEIINTDAEGRLVLADLLHYAAERFKPVGTIDLATLTGACVVALGHHYAGLFATDDTLADRLTAAGRATGERVWRLPLGEEYDKLIESKFADIKNTGGRYAGAITAAQFLKRFAGEGPWAHLDIAGTAFGAPDSEVNRSWGSGFGVRLLDRYVAEHHEG